jgi:hypothetical protein
MLQMQVPAPQRDVVGVRELVEVRRAQDNWAHAHTTHHAVVMKLLLHSSSTQQMSPLPDVVRAMVWRLSLCGVSQLTCHRRRPAAVWSDARRWVRLTFREAW